MSAFPYLGVGMHRHSVAVEAYSPLGTGRYVDDSTAPASTGTHTAVLT